MSQLGCSPVERQFKHRGIQRRVCVEVLNERRELDDWVVAPNHVPSRAAGDGVIANEPELRPDGQVLLLIQQQALELFVALRGERLEIEADAFFQRVARDLCDPALTKKKVVAAVVRLIDKTHGRVGSERYAKENGSFGITTLRKQHARLAGTRIRLSYRAKSGKTQEAAVRSHNLARLIRDGSFDTHLKGLRAEHARRCAQMLAAIQANVPSGALRFARPQGGLYLWCRLTRGLNARAVLQRALEEGVAFVPGDAFYADPAGESELRLCFSSVLPSTMDDAVKKLAASLCATSPGVRRDFVAIA